MDVGYKYIGDKKTDILSIRILVMEKKKVSKENSIPENIQGIPTDVIERSFNLHDN